jgi:hypothetical protein
MRWVSFLVVRVPGCGVEHSPRLPAMLKEEYSNTSVSPLGLRNQLRVTFTFSFKPQHNYNYQCCLKDSLWIDTFHWRQDIRTSSVLRHAISTDLVTIGDNHGHGSLFLWALPRLEYVAQIVILGVVSVCMGVVSSWIRSAKLSYYVWSVDGAVRRTGTGAPPVSVDCCF